MIKSERIDDYIVRDDQIMNIAHIQLLAYRSQPVRKNESFMVWGSFKDNYKITSHVRVVNTMETL